MGAVYFYLPDAGLLVTAYWGRTEIEASHAMREARAADPRRRQARAHVIDMTHHEGTTSPPPTESATFLGLGETYFATYGDLRTVVIASRPHIFGEARIFASVAEGRSPTLNVGVVRSWAEASEYLGIDLGAAQAEVARRRRASEPKASSS